MKNVFKLYLILALLLITSIFVMGAAPDGMTRFTSLWIGGASDTATVTPGDNDVFISGTLEVNGGIVGGAYTIPTATTAYTHDFANGEIVFVNKAVGLASLTVTLPTITAEMHGRPFGIKQIDSGVTAAAVTPAVGVDLIESTLGTLTGTSDSTTDAIGDYKEWVAYYAGSGVSNYWVVRTWDQS